MSRNQAKILVRGALPQDVETLASFNEAMAVETEGLKLDAAAVRAGVKAAIEDPGKGAYFVAECEGRVAGCLMVTYEWSDWRNARFLWIQSVYVDQAFRRRGVFTSLYRHVEGISRGSEYCGLRLYMDEANRAARSTYERLGMSHHGYLVFEAGDALRGGA